MGLAMKVEAASGCALKGCADCLGHTLAAEIACKRNDFKPCKTKLAEAKKRCLPCCQFSDSTTCVRCAHPVADIADAMRLVDLIDASAADYGARFGFDDAEGEFSAAGPCGLCEADPGGSVFNRRSPLCTMASSTRGQGGMRVLPLGRLLRPRA